MAIVRMQTKTAFRGESRFVVTGARAFIEQTAKIVWQQWFLAK